MKTLKLAITTLAFAAVASASAFAANTDSNGNIPNHDNDSVTVLSDSVSGGSIDQTVKPATTLSDRDALLLQLNTDRDNGAKTR